MRRVKGYLPLRITIKAVPCLEEKMGFFLHSAEAGLWACSWVLENAIHPLNSTVQDAEMEECS
jgi:hypothetical protein